MVSLNVSGNTPSHSDILLILVMGEMIMSMHSEIHAYVQKAREVEWRKPLS